MATGFVLTGGQSTRMGRDKALLPIGTQTLCEHIGDILNSVTGKVFLVGHPERYGHLKYQCVADLHPGFGPLSGLETALNTGATELHLIASCDILNIKPEWLRALVSEAEKQGTCCVVLEDAAGKVQPLCGVYRSECRTIVSRALSEQRLRMMDLLKELDARTVKIADVVLNVNTPGEYADGRK